MASLQAVGHAYDGMDLRALNPQTSDGLHTLMESQIPSIAPDFGVDNGLVAESEVELFANALDECLAADGTYSEKRAKLLKLVLIYHEAALSRVEAYGRPSSKHPRSAFDDAAQDSNDMDWDGSEENQGSDYASEEYRSIENEARIWDLLGRLLPLRYPDLTDSRAELISDRQRNGRTSLWQQFVENDSVARERATVLEWLQHNVRGRPDIDELVKDLQQNAERGDIVTHGWLHTKAVIKLRKSIQAWPHHIEPNSPMSQTLLNSDKVPLVTQLDPDSMTRQQCRLQPEDEFFERAIWLSCYELLRRGKSLEEIKTWCLDRTEVWRAVSMSPWLLVQQLEGPLAAREGESLSLWRRMCFALARHGGTDEYERAVYGILSGDIPSAERVCRCWDDFVFTHYNALLQAQLDNFILQLCDPDTSTALRETFPVFDTTQSPEAPGASEKQLMRNLEEDDRTQQEALSPMVAMQAAILADDLDRHLIEQGVVLAQHANIKHTSRIIPPSGIRDLDIDSRKYISLTDHRNLRVITHILVIISALEGLQQDQSGREEGLGHPLQRQVQENLLAAYINFLRLAGLEELIPLYCSRLEGSRIYNVLSRNLIYLTDPERRLVELELIRKAGLDVRRFVTFQPQWIFDELRQERKATLATGLFRIMDNAPTTLKYGRPIKTDFFGEDPDRVEHMDELLIRSLEWLLLVKEAWSATFEIGVRVYKYFLGRLRLNAARALSARVSFATVVKHKIGQAFPHEVDASWFDDTSIWGTGLDNRQIQLNARNFWELESLVRVLDSMETMASLAQLIKEGQSVQRDFWAKVGDEIKTAKVFVQPLLRQWLLNSADEDVALRALRDVYLPETILAYISALHFAGAWMSRDNLLECMELAATIAEKDSDLAACFVKANRMKELVETFAACSKALAMVAGEKKGTSSTSKKLREMGWSRDLWAVRREGGL